MKKYTVLATIALIFVMALTGCGAPALAKQAAEMVNSIPPIAATPAPAAPVAPVSGGAIAALEGTLENIYAKVSPSVVNVQVVQKQTVQPSVMPQLPGLPDLPGFNFGSPQSGTPQELYQKSLGSGFVWDKEGHIVTNNHVVAGADKINVTFLDGTTVQATLVGADPDSDLAVVKVDMPAAQLQPVQVADSTQVKVGELVAAIGNPFGLEGSMTVGFVSALGRSLPAVENSQGPSYTIPDIIQTDASINPGNSGGVLVDDSGSVIGVTAAIESPVRANAGVGFVIPSAIVQKVVPVLIKTGSYEHTWIGISGTSMNPDLAGAMNLQASQSGALVTDVLPNSPADKAGLRGSDRQVTIDGDQVRVGGDVIVAIDGQTVKRFDDVVAYLAHSTEVGQTIKLTVLRAGKEVQVNLTLAARPKSNAQTGQVEKSAMAGAWLGITGVTVNSDIADAMKLASDQKGVLIEQVVHGSPADLAGLQGSYKPLGLSGQSLMIGGDIITAFNGKPVEQMQDLQALVRQAEPDQKVTLTLLRDGKQMEVQVTLSQQP